MENLASELDLLNLSPMDGYESRVVTLIVLFVRLKFAYVRYIVLDPIFLCRAFVYIVGESTVDKALQLSGSDVGGWKAIVTPYPFPQDAGRSITLRVSGYDTSLSEIDIESAIRQHFSSCGEITDVEISKSSAEVDIDGEDAQDKVMELDGSHMGGRKLLVDVVSGGVYTFHTTRHCYLRSRARDG
ncbi:unnamed protein product [Eruca vesicaria subsp. sativa]|uniref:RRM domain-containing protein n=1 Tax=Eruca vesicaria subsp. sativa TaxID=29727 RepID=A0ABC8K9W1_ERUVS|nr:unnamed protein product [Eruca vesicaria subsp. sativa]